MQQVGSLDMASCVDSPACKGRVRRMLRKHHPWACGKVRNLAEVKDWLQDKCDLPWPTFTQGARMSSELQPQCVSHVQTDVRFGT